MKKKYDNQAKEDGNVMTPSDLVTRTPCHLNYPVSWT